MASCHCCYLAFSVSCDLEVHHCWFHCCWNSLFHRFEKKKNDDGVPAFAFYDEEEEWTLLVPTMVVLDEALVVAIVAEQQRCHQGHPFLLDVRPYHPAFGSPFRSRFVVVH